MGKVIKIILIATMVLQGASGQISMTPDTRVRKCRLKTCLALQPYYKTQDDEAFKADWKQRVLEERIEVCKKELAKWRIYCTINWHMRLPKKGHKGLQATESVFDTRYREILYKHKLVECVCGACHMSIGFVEYTKERESEAGLCRVCFQRLTHGMNIEPIEYDWIVPIWKPKA